MTRRSKAEVLATISTEGVVPVFSHTDLGVATAVADALMSGGLSTLEFTNRADGALATMAALIAESRRRLPELTIGAGSIVDGATAAQVIDIGASFIFAPGFSAEVANVCALRNVLYVPGCGTVTEILAAYRAGCDVVKLFPAAALGGPAFLEAVRAPCPWIRAIPTGGVEPTTDSLRSWYRAGAPAVGMGSKLIPKTMIDPLDVDGLRARIRETVAVVAEARSES